jgi:large subunit ribosomal protein L21
MYAIVDIAGKQFHVTQKQRLKVPRLKAEPGKKVQFDRVLVYEDDKGKISFGEPLLKNLNIDATLISHGRDKKVIVFKKKRRKGYRVKRGHRQDFSLIEITAIGTATKAPKPATVAEKKVDSQTEKPKVKATPKPKADTAKTAEKPKAKPAAKTKSTTPRKATTKPKTTPVKKSTSAAKSAKEDKDGS